MVKVAALASVDVAASKQLRVRRMTGDESCVCASPHLKEVTLSNQLTREGTNL